MAVNDVVQGIGLANTILNFQPAATIVITILSVNSITGQPPRLTDGIIKTVHGSEASQYNMRFMITNAFYLQIDNLGGTSRSGYCGIQTQ